MHWGISPSFFTLAALVMCELILLMLLMLFDAKQIKSTNKSRKNQYCKMQPQMQLNAAKMYQVYLKEEPKPCAAWKPIARNQCVP
jgi:hypothetical protein